jgi:hypothetical protein
VKRFSNSFTFFVTYFCEFRDIYLVNELNEVEACRETKLRQVADLFLKAVFK